MTAALALQDERLAFERRKALDLHRRIAELEQRVKRLEAERDAFMRKEETLLVEQAARRLRARISADRMAPHAAKRCILTHVLSGRTEFALPWPQITPKSHVHVGVCETFYVQGLPPERHVGFPGGANLRLIGAAVDHMRAVIAFDCETEEPIDVMATATLLTDPDQEMFSVNPLASGEAYGEHLRRQERAYVENMASGSSSTEDFIKNAYLTLLRRPADQAGLDFYTSIIEPGVLSRKNILKLIIGSDEWRRLHPEFGLDQEAGGAGMRLVAGS